MYEVKMVNGTIKQVFRTKYYALKAAKAALKVNEAVIIMPLKNKKEDL